MIKDALQWVDSIEKGRNIVESLQYAGAHDRITALFELQPETRQLKHETIGNLLGLSRETVTRTMNSLGLYRNKSKVRATMCLCVMLGITLLSSVCFAGRTFSWDPPTTNTDGSPLTDLAGYKIYCGPGAGNYTMNQDMGNPPGNTYNPAGWLVHNTEYWCAATTYDTSANESGYSNEINFIFKLLADIQSPGYEANTGALKWKDYEEPDVIGYYLYWALKSESPPRTYDNSRKINIGRPIVERLKITNAGGGGDLKCFKIVSFLSDGTESDMSAEVCQ